MRHYTNSSDIVHSGFLPYTHIITVEEALIVSEYDAWQASEDEKGDVFLYLQSRKLVFFILF